MLKYLFKHSENIFSVWKKQKPRVFYTKFKIVCCFTFFVSSVGKWTQFHLLVWHVVVVCRALWTLNCIRLNDKQWFPSKLRIESQLRRCFETGEIFYELVRGKHASVRQKKKGIQIRSNHLAAVTLMTCHDTIYWVIVLSQHRTTAAGQNPKCYRDNDCFRCCGLVRIYEYGFVLIGVTDLNLDLWFFFRLLDFRIMWTQWQVVGDGRALVIMAGRHEKIYRTVAKRVICACCIGSIVKGRSEICSRCKNINFQKFKPPGVQISLNRPNLAIK